MFGKKSHFLSIFNQTVLSVSGLRWFPTWITKKYQLSTCHPLKWPGIVKKRRTLRMLEDLVKGLIILSRLRQIYEDYI